MTANVHPSELLTQKVTFFHLATLTLIFNHLVDIVRVNPPPRPKKKLKLIDGPPTRFKFVRMDHPVHCPRQCTTKKVKEMEYDSSIWLISLNSSLPGHTVQSWSCKVYLFQVIHLSMKHIYNRQYIYLNRSTFRWRSIFNWAVNTK